ncbi:MAG TPA: hypothetical protein VLK65_14685 [Vicinamibacteria bacterium]|nr:hypothetical protein [Vicinamibacteria bacterium]
MSPSDRNVAAGPVSRESVAELLDHPGTEETHLLRFLRKRELAPSIIELVARHERWNRRQLVRAALVSHPNTPRTIALRTLQLLLWREQLKVATNIHLAMPLRRAAESRLRERFAQLELGEKVSLARQAPASLVPMLASETEPSIIRALLPNPWLRERDVVRMVESRSTAGPVLAVVGQSDRWVSRPAVLKALVSHRNTPVHLALSLLRRMPNRDLQKLVVDRPLPRVIELGVERILRGERG